MKWWSDSRTAKKRMLACFPIYSRMDDFEIQMRFEGWVKQYPYLRELYGLGKLLLSVDKKDNFIIELKMTDKQFTMWCLKHPETPIRQTFSIYDL